MTSSPMEELNALLDNFVPLTKSVNDAKTEALAMEAEALEIVRQGLGEAYTKYPFEGMEAFVAAEGEARAAGRGLWRP